MSNVDISKSGHIKQLDSFWKNLKFRKKFNCSQFYSSHFESCLSSKSNHSIKEIMAANNACMAVKCAGQAILNFHGNEINVYEVMHVPDLSSIFRRFLKSQVK